MNRFLLALSVGAVCAGLGACANENYYPRQTADFYIHHPVAYDGYYDDFYGNVYDGYWGDEGFYYTMGENQPFLVDRANHFRREDGGQGFHAFHGGVHSAAAHPKG